MDIKKYKRESYYIILSVLNPIASMLSVLITSRYILPAAMGKIQSVLLIISYLSFLQIGIYSGLNRNIAFFKAKEDNEKVQKLVDTSYYYTKKLTILCFVLSLFFVIYSFINLDIIYSCSSILLSIMILANFFTLHFDVTFRSGQEFKTLGDIKLKESLLIIILSILPMFFNYIGYIILTGAKSLYGWFLRCKFKPYKFKGRQNLISLKELISIGFPIMMSGYIWTLFSVADQTYIAYYLSPHDLGLYNIARQCSIVIMIIPSAINTLLYPKAAIVYGKTASRKSLRPFWYKSLLLYLVTMSIITIIGYLVLPKFVEILMPKYIGGIRAGQIAILTGMTYICWGPDVIFGTLKKNILSIAIVSFLLLCFWFIAYFFREYFNTIEKVAWLRFYLFLILMVSYLILTYIYTRK